MSIQEMKSLVKQRGYVQLLIYGLLAIGIISFVGLAVHSYNSAIEKAKTLESANAQLTQLTTDLQTDLAQKEIARKQLELVLAKRQQRREDDEEYNRKLTGVLNALLQHPDVQKWATGGIPLDVISSLRQSGTATDKKDNGKAVSSTKPVVTK